MKGRLRNFWGIAQGIFYANSPETKGDLYFQVRLWAAATGRNLITFTLDLWNDQYNTMHGVGDKDAKRIMKEKAIKRVGNCMIRRRL